MAGANIDTQLGYAFTDRLHIVGISGCKPLDSDQDASTPLDFAKAIFGSTLDIGLADLEHKTNVAIRLHIVNARTKTPSRKGISSATMALLACRVAAIGFGPIAMAACKASLSAAAAYLRFASGDRPAPCGRSALIQAFWPSARWFPSRCSRIV